MPPAATVLMNKQQAGLRAYGAYHSADTRFVSFPRRQRSSQWLNEPHQSPLRGQRWINRPVVLPVIHQLPDYPSAR